MYRVLHIASIFLMSVSATALASQPDSANGGHNHSMWHAPKAMLAVGATLDENGRLWIARVEKQRLLVSWSDDEGKNFSTPVIVTPEPETISADGESRPKIAVARDGTVLLTWVQSLPQKYAGNVRFARSTDSGKSFSAPITLNDDGRITSHRFDSMAIDGNGRVVIAWLDARDRDAAKEKGENFTGTSIYTAKSDNNGKSFGPNHRFHEHTCECCKITLAWTKDGPVALWRNIFGANTRDFAIANLDKGGVRRATRDEWQIDACPHNGGSLAADRWGKLHLAWFTNGTARQGLFYKNIDGDWESRPMPIGNPAAQANHASVVVEDKIVILSWREFDGQSYSVQMMYSVNGGVSWSEPARLMLSAGATDYPVPLISGEKVLVVWNTAKEGLRIVPIERITAGRSS
ncbi:sialidase family protein [Nitrosospira briensis]|uniref:sialidase family protein n=1 Tax=Nitrosospira briensis TaxID=35799 RepID=UPI00055CD562|nr:sialidase family protein [Nitrosospira briensis]